MRDAYPAVQRHCQRRHGLDLSIVDMRWGVADAMTNEHKTTELCMAELEVCQRHSIGPCFVTFLGDKYGYRPFPSIVEATEFEALRAALEAELEHEKKNGEDDNDDGDGDAENAEKNQKEGDGDGSLRVTAADLEMISTWWMHDTNAEPDVYALRPIPSVLPVIEGKSINPAWWPIFERMQVLLRLAVRRAGLPADRVRAYEQSVTEDEIRRGLLDEPESTRGKRCLWFRRVFEDDGIPDDDPVRRFYKDQDQDALDRLAGLKREMESAFSASCPENLVTFRVPWVPGKGVSAEDEPRHASYLDSLCDAFVSRVTALVDAAAEEANAAAVHDGPLLRETARHAEFLRAREAEYAERKDAARGKALRALGLDAASGGDGGENKESGAGGGRPAVVCFTGPCGSGKTCLVAATVAEAAVSLARDLGIDRDACPDSNGQMTAQPAPLVIGRFIGLTPDSSSLLPLLRSLCTQLAEVCSIEGYTPPTSKFDDLAPELSRLVDRAARDVGPLVFFLDGLDNLPGDEAAALLHRWLPLPLATATTTTTTTTTGSSNDNGVKGRFPVKLVLSVDDSAEAMLSSLTNRLNIPTSRIGEMDIADGEAMLGRWLDLNACQLEDVQREHLMRSYFARHPSPLFLRVALDGFVSTWASSEPIASLSLADNIIDLVGLLLERIEIKFGRALVAKTLGLITVSRDGVAMSELLEIVRGDDELMAHPGPVFQYHAPPMRALPPLLWLRIHRDLSLFLAERATPGGTEIYGWYHTVFARVASERYASGPDGDSLREALVAHHESQLDTLPSDSTVAPDHLARELPWLLSRMDGAEERLLENLAKAPLFMSVAEDKFVLNGYLRHVDADDAAEAFAGMMTRLCESFAAAAAEENDSGPDDDAQLRGGRGVDENAAKDDAVGSSRSSKVAWLVAVATMFANRLRQCLSKSATAHGVITEHVLPLVPADERETAGGVALMVAYAGLQLSAKEFNAGRENISSTLAIARAHAETRGTADVGLCLYHLGRFQYAMRDTRDARESYLESIAIYESLGHAFAGELAQSFNNLALVENSLGDRRRALECHAESMRLKRLVFGDRHARVSVALFNIALLLWAEAREIESLSTGEAGETGETGETEETEETEGGNDGKDGKDGKDGNDGEGEKGKRSGVDPVEKAASLRAEAMDKMLDCLEIREEVYVSTHNRVLRAQEEALEMAEYLLEHDPARVGEGVARNIAERGVRSRVEKYGENSKAAKTWKDHLERLENKE